MAQPAGGRKVEILPSSETRFFVTAPALTLTFVKGPDGKVTHVVVSQGGTETQAKKIG